MRIRGSRVTEVGAWKTVSRSKNDCIVDLGERVLIPGLVNAHCHLDYTGMAGQLPPPAHFTDWLKLITETKAGWSLGDYRASWLKGAEMLQRTGTTTVADIEAVPALLPRVWDRTRLRVFSFLEAIGIGARRSPAEVLAELLDAVKGLKHRRCGLGLSPHAPYSTVPALLKVAVREAGRRRWRLCTHAAESRVEFDMFKRAQGEMFEWLRGSGRDMSDCGGRSPICHLEECGFLGRRVLIAHANYLDSNDASVLAKRGVHVVHCPRSHFYFKHRPFPLTRLRRAGVNVCLGTDSLASVYIRRNEKPPVLSMFDEMRHLAGAGGISPRQILQMATLAGARALGLEGRAGTIAPGAYADLVAIPFSRRGPNVYDAVCQHRGPVSASMIGGQWVLRPAEA